MNVRMEENVFIVSNIFSIDVGPQQRLAIVAKREFTRCEKIMLKNIYFTCNQQNANSLDVRNHHRIWDAQKHTLVKLKKKIVDN